MTLPTVKFSRRLGAQSLAVAIVSGLMMSSFGIRTAEAHEPIFAPVTKQNPQRGKINGFPFFGNPIILPRCGFCFLAPGQKMDSYVGYV